MGDEEKSEIRVVSGKTNLIPHIETSQLQLQSQSAAHQFSFKDFFFNLVR